MCCRVPEAGRLWWGRLYARGCLPCSYPHPQASASGCCPSQGWCQGSYGQTHSVCSDLPALFPQYILSASHLLTLDVSFHIWSVRNRMPSLLQLLFLNKIVSEKWTSVAVCLCMCVQGGSEGSVRMISCLHLSLLGKQNTFWKSTNKQLWRGLYC